jgi:hypothetical protein
MGCILKEKNIHFRQYIPESQSIMHYYLILKNAWINFKENTPKRMKKTIFLIWISILYTIFLFAGCGSIPGSGDSEHYIIDITGAPIVINCSKSYTFAGHYACEEEDTVSLAVSDGDLIYFQLMEDEILCYRYNPSDGLNLSISYDTSYESFYLNEELISASLSEGSAAWDWLAGADRDALAGIRSLYISLPLSEAEINSLKRISGLMPNTGLFIEGDSLIEDVISVIKPVWLIAEDLNFSTISDDARSSLKHLELLWHSGEDTIDFEFIYGLPDLNSLIIEYWDSTDISSFQFEKLTGLESLSIIESDLHDLAHIAASSEIINLNLIHCETLERIGSITDLNRLASLGLTGCENINDIPAILQMSSLARLSIPGNTTQIEFAEIISRQKELQVLELIGCDSITDLSPLQDYAGLRALTLDCNVRDLKPVYPLTALELLVLAEDFFEDSLALSEIKQAMPDTRLVAGGGFCLGSGWILLLPPAILIGVIARKRFTRSRIARVKR